MKHFAPEEFTPEEEALYIYNNATDWKDARKMLMAWHLQDCTKEYKQKIHSIVGWLCEKHGYFTVHLNHEAITGESYETF